jgi:hypothetical protein
VRKWTVVKIQQAAGILVVVTKPSTGMSIRAEETTFVDTHCYLFFKEVPHVSLTLSSPTDSTCCAQIAVLTTITTMTAVAFVARLLTSILTKSCSMRTALEFSSAVHTVIFLLRVRNIICPLLVR